MADPITDPKQAGERLLAFAREGRLVQGTWHALRDGREFACHLGAAAGIEDAAYCPASLMPEWVARALPGLFDGQTKAHAVAFARRWGKAMVRDEWSRIDWNTVRRKWMAFVVKQASAAAPARAVAAASAIAAARDAYATAAEAEAVASYSAAAAGYAADAASYAVADDARAVRARAAARDAQADALMAAIERAMEVARG